MQFYVHRRSVGHYRSAPICPTQLWVLVSALFFLAFTGARGQEINLAADSVRPTINLHEVIVVSSFKNAIEHKAHHKPLSTLDEYLESSKKVNMIKRGAYAWEPLMNDMATERLSVTLDGMRIFGGCTDKMDPVTAYVDVSNLAAVHVVSGQKGAEHGTVIGGAIDMRTEKGGFVRKGWNGAIETGGEANNLAAIFGAELNFSNDGFYADTDVIYRKAENYWAGGAKEVLYSQFGKFNLSTNLGFKVGDGQTAAASFIFDQANNVGYPALTMDVSLARAFIGSLSWSQANFIGAFKNWETKLYANSITHVMDDSKRPDVPIRMDMPGWSDTYGYYSQATLELPKHALKFKFDGFYNRSLAEMTMYPVNPNEREMFMLTWPDVRTLNTAFYAQDVMAYGGGSLIFATRLAMQDFNVANDFGLNSLRIFYPGMAQRQTRFLKSISANYEKKFRAVHLNGGVAYGDRAPSVSEGFGFYLFNSFDNHDYIGDPGLKNEESVELNAKVAFPHKKGVFALEGNYFHINDYILGEIDPGLSVMTIGADGVKIYSNLDRAMLYTISVETEYHVTPQLHFTGVLAYHRGTDHRARNLPFISPLGLYAQLRYSKGNYTGVLAVNAAADQTRYNAEFGEDRTQAYAVASLSVAKSFAISADYLMAKAGVENIFDAYYSTYTDWKNIPRMGRNMYLNLSYAFN